MLRGVLVNGNGIYCAQHNEHAKHANARGSEGMPPPGKFEKLDTHILNLVGFEHKSLTYIKLKFRYISSYVYLTLLYVS